MVAGPERAGLVSVIVPAHDEAAVIERSLRALLAPAEGPAASFEVLVVANGCRDDTADTARRAAAGLPGRVEVIELAEPSKTGAVRAGLARARGDVVAVVDADVIVTATGLAELADALRGAPGPRVGAPALTVDTGRSPWLVRRYYRAWQAMPYVREDMIGSGVFAVNAAGRDRLAGLPDVLNDDGWLRRSFPPEERMTGHGSFAVLAPRTVSALLARRARVDVGSSELNRREPRAAPSGNGLRAVLAAVRAGRVRPLDAAAFTALSLTSRWMAGRRRRRGQAGLWSQDATSREL